MSSEEQEFKPLILVGPGTPLEDVPAEDEQEPSTRKPSLQPLDEDDPTFAQPNVPARIKPRT